MVILGEKKDEISSNQDFRLHIFSQTFETSNRALFKFSSSNEERFKCDILQLPVTIPMSASSQISDISGSYVAEQLSYPCKISITPNSNSLESGGKVGTDLHFCKPEDNVVVKFCRQFTIDIAPSLVCESIQSLRTINCGVVFRRVPQVTVSLYITDDIVSLCLQSTE